MMTLVVVLVGALALFIFLIGVRGRQIFQEIEQTRAGNYSSVPRRSRSNPCKTLVVLGSGGHTSEMLHMVRQLDGALYQPIVYVVAATDHTSVQRLKATMSRSDNTDPTIHIIPRSREVGQSYVTSLLTTLYALVHAFVLTARIRPELLLCNGPGTCVPIVLSAWVLKLVGISHCKIVFCESYCRVQTLSLTGRLLYPLVDCFMVHWDPLIQKYPKSHRISTFVSATPKS